MADNFEDWPIIINDDGSLSFGTPFSAEYNDAVRASVADQVYSSTNPAILPRMITDEVVDARGNMDSLDERLSGVIDDDGALIAGAASVSQAQIQAVLGSANLVGNDVYALWTAGDTAAPNFFTLAGTGAAVARAGVLTSGSESATPGDVNRKVGDFSAKLTSGGGAVATLTQILLSTSAMTRAGVGFKGQPIGFGAWVKTSSTNAVRIGLSDGTGTTYTAYHTGGGDWEFLAATRTLSASATSLSIFTENGAGAIVSYTSGMVAARSVLAPTGWAPGGWFRREVRIFSAGAQTATAAKEFSRFIPSENGLVQSVLLFLGTVNTGANFLVDVNLVGTGSLFAAAGSQPVILDGANPAVGTAEPTGVYARRCLAGGDASTTQLMIDIDTVGSGVAGSDLTVLYRILEAKRPQDMMFAYSD